MLRLDPVFREQLLERHQSVASSNKGKVESLTPEILDKYETLVGQKFILEKARRGIFVQELDEKPDNPDNVDIKKNGNTESDLDIALKRVNKAIDETRRKHLPKFNEVHRDWLDNRRSRELGNANRAFKRRWQPTQDRKGGFSGFAVGIVLVFVFGFTTIGFFSSEKFGQGPRLGTAVDKLVPSAGSVQHKLNEAEKQLMEEWHKGAKTGQSNYLYGLVHINSATAKSAATKLHEQAKILVERQEFKDALDRLHWASEIAVVLENLFGDGDLKVQVNNTRNSINQLTAKP